MQSPRKRVKGGEQIHMAKINKEELMSAIEEMSVLELSDLVKALEEKFGVSAAAMAVAAPAAAPAADAAPAEEQTSFNVILASSGANKIGVIKAIRELVPTLGLKEAKDLADTAPKEVLTGVNKKTADEAKEKLTAAGGTVELK
ncbi:MAG: large subunit ribosomal protein [Patescibacteria group bacterium]|jgi:large subunit ribosomal protein L7/L12|nr:large subunit ribosomal protein [Patescibacteria group bacterium]